uniref:OSJNBb0018J12.9 protein n=1 Tax=Oryza sativa subsp. japonica TaxID=39947 RepID=Q7XM50_ORYSJ|nr:OSJNBb0018J12.9 [Oryza sativa Japonica Group]
MELHADCLVRALPLLFPAALPMRTLGAAPSLERRLYESWSRSAAGSPFSPPPLALFPLTGELPAVPIPLAACCVAPRRHSPRLVSHLALS